LQRDTADERFVKAIGFLLVRNIFNHDFVSLTEEASPVNSHSVSVSSS
jgi:hypothetical protein